MQEDFLHYIWKFQKFRSTDLFSVTAEKISVLNVGQHNLNAGPDFFNAQLRIDDQLWAGNVEIHINSSDWYLHNHEKDPQYDSVILHVVWNHDTEIYRKDNSPIPTFQLKGYVNENVAYKYYELMSNKNQFINCEKDFGDIDEFTFDHWMERLYFERLEKKSEFIFDLLKKSNNDWESVLFKMLAKNFGLKVNGDSFFSMAQSFDFSLVRKLSSNPFQLEALFFGQLHLLEKSSSSPYENQLAEEYRFSKYKYKLDNSGMVPVNFFRLRPPNFPTIRLSQLANLYHQNASLFSTLNSLQSIKEIQSLFKVEVSDFWQTHYTFKTESRYSKKVTSPSFIDLLIINTIIPIKFSYLRSIGLDNNESIIQLSLQIASEKNSIIDKFQSVRKLYNSSMISQALLHLKLNYCDLNHCLKCEIGNQLLKN